MKKFEPAATVLVQRIFEAMDNDDDDDLDPKDVYNTEPSNEWEQISGDYGDPWVYGGSWFNAAQSQVIHFNGIETEGGEIDSDDIEVPATMLAKLPPEQPGWYDNRERDEAIEWYKIAKADFLNARKPYDFYLIPVDMEDTELPDWMKKYENPNEYDGWNELSLPQKLIEIGGHIGMNEIGEPMKMSHLEAQKFLGPGKI